MGKAQETRVDPMVRRSTWILLIVFALLIGFAFFFERYQTNKAENGATTTPTVSKTRLYDLDSSKIIEVVIVDATGKQLDLYRDPGSTQWAVRDYPQEQADTFQIESVTAQLFSIQAQELLTQAPPLDSVGLNSPAYTITMIGEDGTKVVTYVGSKTPIGSGYYVRVGSGQVAVVDKGTMDNVIDLISNPPLVATATPESIETIVPTGTIIAGTPTP